MSWSLCQGTLSATARPGIISVSWTLSVFISLLFRTSVIPLAFRVPGSGENFRDYSRTYPQTAV